MIVVKAKGTAAGYLFSLSCGMHQHDRLVITQAITPKEDVCGACFGARSIRPTTKPVAGRAGSLIGRLFFSSDE